LELFRRIWRKKGTDRWICIPLFTSLYTTNYRFPALFPTRLHVLVFILCACQWLFFPAFVTGYMFSCSYLRPYVFPRLQRMSFFFSCLSIQCFLFLFTDYMLFRVNLWLHFARKEKERQFLWLRRIIKAFKN